MTLLYPRFLLLAVFALLSQLVSAQKVKGSFVGVSALADYEPDKGVKLGFGFLFERRFSKRSGVEAGVFYNADRTSFHYSFPLPEGGSDSYFVEVRESYLTFPVLYRYYTTAVTVSVGPSVEAFVAWDQLSQHDTELVSYKVSPAVRYGPLFKVSKAFPLGEKLRLEPELRFGIMVNGISTAYYGVGVQLKQSVGKRN